MPNPWMILGALAVVIAAYFYGHHEGGNAVTAQWEIEKSQANQQSAEVLQQANARALDAERALAKKQVKMEKIYVENVREVEVVRDQLVNVAHTDGLFIDATCSDSSGKLPGVATSAGGNYGTTKARLSESTAEALINIAADGDKIVQQLTACQSVLNEERMK